MKNLEDLELVCVVDVQSIVIIDYKKFSKRFYK